MESKAKARAMAKENESLVGKRQPTGLDLPRWTCQLAQVAWPGVELA